METEAQSQSFAEASQGHYSRTMQQQPLLLDSITDADAVSTGRIVISGSHGGIYPAAVASKWAVRAVMFNDAGIGLENAGVAGVLELAKVGMASAAMDCQSCRIGSAADGVARGQVSIANAIAAELGITSGMAVSTALERLAQAPEPQGQLAPVDEARHQVMLESSSAAIWLLDSASLVKPEDEGETIITGSHGGLIGGDPSRALKAKAKIVVFNAAGVGIEGIGITRLPALDKRGVAAVAVDCQTARIGDAASALDTGLISHANQTAMNLAAAQGLALKAWLETCT